jgi:hypothetical protein
VLFEGQSKLSTKKPVIDENYNEIVFVEPAPALLGMLNSTKRNPQGYQSALATAEAINTDTEVKALKVVDRLALIKNYDDEDFK